MSISTKTGDTGQTALFGGVRVDKDHIRVECNGLIDEVNTRIGLLLVEIETAHSWSDRLLAIQRDIMLMMSHIATPPESTKPNKKLHPENGLSHCEDWVEELKDALKDEKLAFVLPGGNKVSGLCHFVRTGLRSAERKLVTLNKMEPLPAYLLQYFNRMSDLFYMLAMVEMKNSDVKVDKFMVFPSQKGK